jgi:hypothetical protein
MNVVKGSSAVVYGAQSRVFTVIAQSKPLLVLSAKVDVPGVLPDRAYPGARPPLPQTAVSMLERDFREMKKWWGRWQRRYGKGLGG